MIEKYKNGSLVKFRYLQEKIKILDQQVSLREERRPKPGDTTHTPSFIKQYFH